MTLGAKAPDADWPESEVIEEAWVRELLIDRKGGGTASERRGQIMR